MLAKDALLHVEKGGCLLTRKHPCTSDCFQKLVKTDDGFNSAMNDLAAAEQAEQHLNIAFITEQKIKANKTARARKLTLLEFSKWAKA